MQVFAFVEVPQLGLAILASRSAEGSIWRDGHSVQAACVANVIGLQLTVYQVPYLISVVLSLSVCGTLLWQP